MVSIADQIKMIEANGFMTVLEVTKHGNFICFDSRHLKVKPFIDAANTVRSPKTVRELIKNGEVLSKYKDKLREKGVIE